MWSFVFIIYLISETSQLPNKQTSLLVNFCIYSATVADSMWLLGWADTYWWWSWQRSSNSNYNFYENQQNILYRFQWQRFHQKGMTSAYFFFTLFHFRLDLSQSKNFLPHCNYLIIIWRVIISSDSLTGYYLIIYFCRFVTVEQTGTWKWTNPLQEIIIQ